ncbi:lymphocyte activation gene 3 protein-like [Scyliorhinus torazame]|uniref:lymphocyte activation gene 3 protein-like n=1 Tax=Scyliorhinus torazame TaxID=75743 RepID=UPI0030857112|nr:T-cell surface glycoprotein CD4 [Scyliorhinus torazame]
MCAQGRIYELVLFLTSLQHVSYSLPVTEKDKIYATVGDTVTFLCQMNSPSQTPMSKIMGGWKWRQSESDQPAKTIFRYNYDNFRSKGNIDLVKRSRMSAKLFSGNFSLIVSSVQTGDAGYFDCDFSYMAVEARVKIHLDVVTVTSSSSKPSLEGDSVELTCHAPAGKVSWNGPGHTQSNENTVMLSAISLLHAGKWTCNVEFTKKTLQTSYVLDVIGFTNPVERVIGLPVGSSAHLPCTLNRFPSTRPVQGAWLRGVSELVSMNVSTKGWMWRSPQNTRIRTPRHLSESDMSVVLTVRTLGDGGDYICQLHLQNRNISRKLSVTVIQVSVSEPGTISIGSNISLSCLISHQSPSTQIQWRHSNMSSKGGLAQGKNTLTINLIKVTKHEAGVWICEISQNNARLGEATLILNVTEPVISIFGKDNLILMIGTSASLLFLIVIFTLIGNCLAKRARRRRQALRRLRHPLCREHSHQLSNQPLCNSNDYTKTERPLPPLPRYCPHQPRRGRSSQGKGNRLGPRGQYIA